MPVYRGRREKTWRVTVWSGRQHEWIVEGTRAEALEFEARKRIELGAGKKEPRTAPTFSNFCVHHYRPYAETHLGADTWNKVRIYQVATLEEHFGPVKLSELTPRELAAYKSARLQDGASAVSINNELRVLRAMLNWARDDQKLLVADLKVTMLPTKGKRRVHYWTSEEIGRLYDAARSVAPELLPMLVFLLNTGCRKGEALAAQWSWVDKRRSLLCIPVTDEWQPKSRRAREVPISDALSAVLSGPRLHPEFIFPSSLGERFKSFPKETFWKVRALAKLKGGPHTTRHTFASHFLQAVPDLFLLAQVLGHSHSRTTELYAHLLPGHLARAKNAVNLAPKTLAVTLAKKKKQA